jgi:short-subunit dehydrogenase
MELDGRTILLTGSNRGIGHALLSRLAREPVRLLAGVRELDRYAGPDTQGEPVAAEIVPVRVDLSTRASIDESCDGLDPLGATDVLINNAGSFVGGTVEQLDVDAIYRTIQVNLAGLIHLTRRVLPGMLARGSGKVVNNSSVVGYVHFPGVSTYSAAKSGVSGFTESLRRELADTPLSTLHVVTGGISTDMLDEAKDSLREQFPGADNWDQQTPDEWADKIVDAIVKDKDVLGPGGKSALAKLTTHLPSFVLDTIAERGFSRTS